MKNSSCIATTARGLSALGLCVVGLLAFIVGIVVFFGWLMKDRKSDPDPTIVQIVVSMAVGSLILIASVACFVLARGLLRRISSTESQPENVR